LLYRRRRLREPPLFPDRVAVLGAGIQGSCVALELARRGCAVDLYDRNELPIQQASLYNEGKIHLGFVYGRDGNAKTAETMVRGSLRFASLLERWLGVSADALEPSPGFVYAVHRDTMTPPEQVGVHFERVRRLYDDMIADETLTYLGARPARLVERLSQKELVRTFDDRLIITAYRTAERSVAPCRVAALLRDAIAAHPRIAFMGKTLISDASIAPDGRVRVGFSCNGTETSVTYPHVVNALWAGRLHIDGAVGVLPSRPWLHRFKLAVVLRLSHQIDEIPSATFVLGPFGDIVNFGGSRLYLSWYPHCMIGVSRAINPPDLIAALHERTTSAIVHQTMAALAAVCPPLRSVGDAITTAEVGGGPIFAWGASDIDDPESELHRRYDVGVSSYGRYHSVNTGKYCLAPLLAVEVAERICP
jgi:glycine/D-amino acid oxidase-like deaminating enzyme